MNATWPALSDDLGEADRALVSMFDRTLAASIRGARRHLQCRIGCTACCIGPFDITTLDAARLAVGMALLEQRHPRIVARLRARSREQWRMLGAAFPGDAETGRLDDDDDDRERFFARFADLHCAALDPRTGRCILYAYRPLSCRSFGLPVRVGEEVLEPCELNFREASPAEVKAATAEPDPEDREGQILADLAGVGIDARDTIVAAVLALAGATDENDRPSARPEMPRDSSLRSE